MSKISLLSQCLVEKYGISQSQANDFVNNMFSLIRERLLEEHIVKVKGLGTFKLAEMSARESININTGERITIEGRYKLSFTPENAVRDRINSPFAQFESIDIDDDMDFTAIDNNYPSESVPEEAPVAIDEPEVAAPEPQNEDEVVEEPVSVPSVEHGVDTLEENQSTALPVEEHEVSEPEEEVSQPEHEVEEPSVPEPVVPEPAVPEPTDEEKPAVSAPMSEVRSPFCEELIREELHHSRKIMTLLKWLIGLIVVLLVFVAMFFVYNLGKHVGQGMQATPDKTVENSIVAVPDTVVPDTATVSAPVDTIKVEKVEEKKAEPQLENQDVYNKDARVRTGAYVIIGLDTTVTVQEGQTLKGISKAYLGDGMECYVEVFNNGITSVKSGDKIRIPKVMLKKRLRK